MGPDNQTNIHTQLKAEQMNESKWAGEMNNRTNILCNQLYQIRINYLMCVRLAALDVVFIGSFHFEWTLIASFSLMLVWPVRMCIRTPPTPPPSMSKAHFPLKPVCLSNFKVFFSIHRNMDQCYVLWRILLFALCVSLFHFTSRSHHRYKSLYIIAHSAHIWTGRKNCFPFSLGLVTNVRFWTVTATSWWCDRCNAVTP